VKEFEALRGARRATDRKTLKPGDDNPLREVRDKLVEFETTIDPRDASQIQFNLHGAKIIYDAKKGEISCLGRKATIAPKPFKLRALIDTVAIDLFWNDGEVYMPMGFIPKDNATTLELTAIGGEATVSQLDVWPLKSAWE
jgi:fructan beta-fructosidase